MDIMKNPFLDTQLLLLLSSSETQILDPKIKQGNIDIDKAMELFASQFYKNSEIKEKKDISFSGIIAYKYYLNNGNISYVIAMQKGKKDYNSIFIEVNFSNKELAPKYDKVIDEIIKSYKEIDILDKSSIKSYSGKEEQKNFGYCNSLSEIYNKDRCFFDIARINNDESICDRIQALKDRELCFVELNQDEILCDKLISEKDACYKLLAEKKQDTNFCDKVKNNIIKINCFKRVAIIKNDASICEKIKYIEENEEIKKLYGYDIYTPSEYCFDDVATAAEDYLICNKIICEKISNRDNCGLRNGCYKKIAEKKVDHSICNFIAVGIDKWSCYGNIARVQKDELICDKIENVNIRDDCYLNIAEAKLNKTICEKIIDQWHKEICYNFLKNRGF